MSKQSSKTMAVMGWGYDNIMLPIEKAHQLQQILAGDDVIKCSHDWAEKPERNMYTLTVFEAPSVETVKKGRMIVDLTVLTEKQRRDYQSEVLHPYREGTSDVMMGVQEWLALRGGE